MDEQWRPIDGWPYDVSDQGRVRRRDGGRGTRAGKLVKPYPTGQHVSVRLSREGKRWGAKVHWLVAAAFLGPRPEGAQVCHGNGVGADNRVANLRYDSRAENALDEVRAGRHYLARRTHCRAGHPFDEANTLWRHESGRRPYRRCRTCERS